MLSEKFVEGGVLVGLPLAGVDVLAFEQLEHVILQLAAEPTAAPARNLLVVVKDLGSAPPALDA